MQHAKINSSYSDWYDVVRGVPQRSILAPLLFNLLMISFLLLNEQMFAILQMMIPYVVVKMT